MRRFYQILQRTVIAFLIWFGSLTVLLFCDCTKQELATSPYNSAFFFLLQLPLYGIILFGCYALISIGWHLFTLSKNPKRNIIFYFRGLWRCLRRTQRSGRPGTRRSRKEGSQVPELEVIIILCFKLFVSNLNHYSFIFNHSLKQDGPNQSNHKSRL